MNRFRVVEGIHFEQDGKKYEKGDVVTTPHDLIALFPQKFVKVGDDEGGDEGSDPKPNRGRTMPGQPNRLAVASDDWEEEDATTAAKAKGNQVQQGKRTMRE